MAEYLMSELQVPGVGDPVMIIKDKEARQDLSTALATVTGNPLNFSTRSAQKANKTVISLEPIQDLHGYDHPWPAGGGKNKAKDYTFSGSQNGVSFSYADGVCTISTTGAATADSARPTSTWVISNNAYALLPAGTYTCTMFGDVPSGVSLNVVNADTGAALSNKFTIGESTKVFPRVRVVEGTNIQTPISVKFQIEEGEQATSFAPYSNICPIDGRTETSLVRTGENFVDEVKVESIDYTTGNPIEVGNNMYRTAYAGNLKKGTYLLSIDGISTRFIRYAYEYNESTEIIGVAADVNTYSVTLDKDVTNFRFSIRKRDSSNITESIKVSCINPNQSNNLTIQFGEKVYGATVELEKGTVTVDREIVDMGDLTYTYNTNYNHPFFLANITDKKNGSESIICSIYKYGQFITGTTTLNNIENGTINVNNAKAIYIRDDRFDNTTDFTTAVTGQKVVYELATPRTIQLTPNEISLLSGVNVISSNADGISLTYRDGKVATLGDLDSLNVTISNALEGKVDEVSGKGLSTNDYTDEEKAKVAEVDDKANDDGSYGDMAVGSLLMSNVVKSTNTIPFLFRPIPPLSTPYIREKLVGASMAWNQLAKVKTASASPSGTGLTITGDASTGIISVSGTVETGVTQVQIPTSIIEGIGISGHNYYMKGKLVSGSYTNSLFWFGKGTISFTFSTDTVKSATGTIYNQNLYLNVTTGATLNFSFKVILIDLTLAFSPAIADRIYSMEQAQAGSGIAWIKSYGFLTDDYYANDGGSVQSVCVDRKEIVGKNLLSVTVATDTKYGMKLTVDDKGIIELSGTPTDLAVFNIGSAKVDSSMGNIVLCGISNAVNTMWNTMSLKDQNGIVLYEWINNNNLVKSINLGDYPTVSSVEVTIKRKTNNVAVSGYITPIIAVGTTEVEFEPYHKTTISLGHDELRGVMQLDANNNLVYYGDEKTNDGVIDRKFSIVDLGSLEWTLKSSDSNYFFQTNNITDCKGGGLAINTKGYIKVASMTGTTTDDKAICIYGSENIRIRDSSYSDATTFKTSLSGVYLVYELATPTTEQSTPFEFPQYLFNGGTEEFIDYGVEQETRDVAVPVGHVTEYMGDSEGTEIKDKFYLPTLPNSDGEYIPHMRIQGGMITGFWFEPVVEDDD